MNKTLDSLFEEITAWADDKNILDPNRVLYQHAKLTEEIGELAAGILKDNEAKRRDAMGDVFVVWTVLCNQLGYNPIEVVNEVYEIISKRKGITKDGVFIKEEDLVE